MLLIVLAVFDNSRVKAHKRAPAATKHDYRSAMTSRRSTIAWIVFGIALIGAPAAARGQAESSEVTSTALRNDTAIRVPDVRELVIEGAAHALSNGADTHREGLFRALNTAFLVTATADISISMYQIDHGVAREGGFGAQWQDSPVAFAITKSAMATAFAYGLNRIHKTRPKTAFILGIAATAFEGWLAVRGANISPQHP